MDDQRDVMRASAKKKEGQRHALPPQIFNGEKYCGDYDDFDVANEDDELEEFLGIPRKTPKKEPEAPKEEGARELRRCGTVVVPRQRFQPRTDHPLFGRRRPALSTSFRPMLFAQQRQNCRL